MPPLAFDAASCIHVIVESPKGSQVKLKYSSALRATGHLKRHLA